METSLNKKRENLDRLAFKLHDLSRSLFFQETSDSYMLVNYYVLTAIAC